MIGVSLQIDCGAPSTSSSLGNYNAEGRGLLRAQRLSRGFESDERQVLDTIQMDRGMMRIRGVIEEVDSLPALRIRIHKPRTRPLERAPCTGSTRPVCRHALQEFDGTQFCIMNVNGTVLAQLGCGYWGPNLLRNFSSLTNCRVKYVVDSSPERRAFVEANFPRTTAVDSYDAVLADPEVSGVLIATPAGTHFRLAKQALLAGKNVFVEKPLATKVAEVDELDQLAAERSLLVMAGHTFLYNEAVRYVKRLHRRGRVRRGPLYL